MFRICICILLMWAPLILKAQGDTARVLSEVVVTGINQTRTKNTSLNIQTLQLADMEQKGASNLSEGLSGLPGISQITTGISIAKPVIRGLYGNRILVLLSDLRFDNQQWQDEHGMGLSYIGIERVEVIKGPASVLYGTDALGGVINIIEERPDTSKPRQFDLNTRFFSNTLGTLTDAGYRFSSEKKWWRIRAGFENHADYADGKGDRVLNSRNNGYYLKSGYGFSRLKWKSENTYNFSWNNYGFIIEDLHDFFDADARWSRKMAGPHHSVLLNILGSKNTLQLKKSVLIVNSGVQSNLRMEDEGGGHISLNMHLLSLLNNLKWERQLDERTLLVANNQLTLESNTNYGARIIVPDARFFEASGALFIRHFYRRLIAEVGANISNRNIHTFRTANLNAPGKEIQPFNINRRSVNGLAGFSYTPRKRLNVKLNASSGFRAPNLAELSSQGLHEGVFRYEIGSPLLKVEKLVNIDLNGEFKSDFIFVSLSGFVNRFFGYIYLAPTTEEFFGFPVFRFRQQDATLYGGEAQFFLKPMKNLQWKNSFSIVLGDLDNGQHLPFIPPARISSSLRFEKKKAGTVKLWYAEPGVIHAFAQKRPALFETKTPAYFLFNFSAGIMLPFKKDRINLSLSCTNLLNEKYADHLSRLKNFGILNAGRNIFISIKIPFSLTTK